MTKGLAQLAPGDQHLELVEKTQCKGPQQAFAALPRQVKIVDMQLALAADGVTDQHPQLIRHRRRLNRRYQQRVGLKLLPQCRRQHVGDLGQRLARRTRQLTVAVAADPAHPQHQCFCLRLREHQRR